MFGTSDQDREINHLFKKKYFKGGGGEKIFFILGQNQGNQNGMYLGIPVVKGR